MILFHPFFHVDDPGDEGDPPFGKWDLEKVDGIEKRFISGEVSPHDHIQCGGGGLVVQGQEVRDGRAEDSVASEWVGCLTSLEVLDPCKDEGNELWDSDVAFFRVVELMEVSCPCSK
jgi:hypothetical protein